jgi:hypothetical protein
MTEHAATLRRNRVVTALAGVALVLLTLATSSRRRPPVVDASRAGRPLRGDERAIIAPLSEGERFDDFQVARIWIEERGTIRILLARGDHQYIMHVALDDARAPSPAVRQPPYAIYFTDWVGPRDDTMGMRHAHRLAAVIAKNSDRPPPPALGPLLPGD